MGQLSSSSGVGQMTTSIVMESAVWLVWRGLTEVGWGQGHMSGISSRQVWACSPGGTRASHSHMGNLAHRPLGVSVCLAFMTIHWPSTEQSQAQSERRSFDKKPSLHSFLFFSLCFCLRFVIKCFQYLILSWSIQLPLDWLCSFSNELHQEEFKMMGVVRTQSSGTHRGIVPLVSSSWQRRSFRGGGCTTQGWDRSSVCSFSVAVIKHYDESNFQKSLFGLMVLSG